MTALKPTESSQVRGVTASRYRLNDECAHPGCKDHTADPHHIFPRSQVASDSWFVTIEGSDPVPHVTGLCREHHDDLEEHRAWVKLEEGVYNWYIRMGEDWLFRGKLNPQPPAYDPRPKRDEKRPRKTGEDRAQRKTITLRVPTGAPEDGAGLLDEAIAQAEERLGYEKPRPPYYTLMDALNGVILHGVD
jgi:hypothetical protein